MKRRLQLMPEVLPAPNKVATSAVRARTLARLRVLAAVGAGIAAACAGKTEPTPGGGGSSGGGPDGGLPNGRRPDAGDPYGVVDPLPRPTCFEGALPTATASYVSAQDAGVDASADPDAGATFQARYVRLVVAITQKDVAVGDITVEAGAATAAATIVEKSIAPGAIELVLRQPPGPDDIDATIDIQTSCATGPSSLEVRVRDTGTLSAQVQAY